MGNLWSMPATLCTRGVAEPEIRARGSACYGNVDQWRPPSQQPVAPIAATRAASALRTFAQKDMGCPFTGDVFGAFISERTQIDVVQQVLAGAEQHGTHGEMHLVDQAGAEILPNRRHAAADAHVALAGCGLRLLERRVDAVGDKKELGAAGHLERRPRVMRQHEHGGVIRRLVPRQPFQLSSGHGRDRTEHLAAEDPRARPVYPRSSDLIVDAVSPFPVRTHALPDACERTTPSNQGR